jgi:hypothetical protein
MNQLNIEIINKIINTLYAFIYTDEEATDDVLIIRYEEVETRIEINMEVKKNCDGLISDCSIHAIINP